MISNRTSGVKSLERALHILEIARENGKLEVKELSRQMNLHRSSIYRILSLLQSKGYIRRDQVNNNYSLGFKFLEMAESINYYQELKDTVMPFLKYLMQQTRETTHLMVFEQGEVVYLAKVESPETIRMHSRVGFRMPAYSTAGGKVLLSYLPLTKQKYFLKKMHMKKITPNTITDPKILLEKLAVIAKQGWAIDNEENEKGIYCAAAPIRRADGKVIAAVTVSCPTFRTSMDNLEKHVAMVKSVTEKISRSLDYD